MLDLMGRDVMFDQPDQEGKIEREESYLLSIDRGRSSRDRRLGIQYRTHSTCVKGRTSFNLKKGQNRNVCSEEGQTLDSSKDPSQLVFGWATGLRVR